MITEKFVLPPQPDQDSKPYGNTCVSTKLTCRNARNVVVFVSSLPELSSLWDIGWGLGADLRTR